MELVHLKRSEEDTTLISFPWSGVQLLVRTPNSMVVSAARAQASRIVEALQIGLEEGTSWGLAPEAELEEGTTLLSGLRELVLATTLMQLITAEWNVSWSAEATEPEPIDQENCRQLLADPATFDQFMAKALALSPWTIGATEGNDLGLGQSGASGPVADDAPIVESLD
jgi:hypothetical protein